MDETTAAQRARLALYDALDLASASVLYAGTDDGKAREAYFEASAAALAAFPEGSRESAALNIILGAVGGMTRTVTA